jgi:hypothetical protein
MPSGTWGEFLWSYAIAVWNFWYTIVLGVLLFVVDIVERKRGKELPFLSKISVPTLLLTILISELLGAHTLYDDQQNQYASLHGQYDDLNRKNEQLLARMTGLHPELGTVQMLIEPRLKTPVLLINIGIRNSGNPTVARGFDLRIKLKGTVYPSTDYYHPQYIPGAGIVPVDEKGKPEMRIVNDDQIVEKASTPIPSGGYVNGWLVYRLAGCGKRGDATWIISRLRDFVTQGRVLAASAGGPQIVFLTCEHTSALAYAA